MAEEVEATAGAARGSLGFLGKKAGPLPIGVWIAAALAIYLYMSHRGKSGATGSGAQTDSAGNVGTIDPQTGYVYGTPQDQSALAENAGAGGTTTGTGGSTTGGQYPDNNAWAVAAINYLVGLGIDPTAANSAITQFLASQSLTSSQQANVNLAIQRIGAPPSPPQPGTTPTPIVQPPGGNPVYATNPPTGLTVTSKSADSIGVKWNSSTNATAYTVSWGPTAQAAQGSTTVTGTRTSFTITGLKPSTLYFVRVQATPAKGGAGFASVQATTPKSAGGTSSGGGTKRPGSVRAQEGDSFSKIASKYKVPGGGMALYEFQLSTPQHSAAAKKEIRDRGYDHVVVGEEIFLPQS